VALAYLAISAAVNLLFRTLENVLAVAR
jgi:hypothetical protein